LTLAAQRLVDKSSRSPSIGLAANPSSPDPRSAARRLVDDSRLLPSIVIGASGAVDRCQRSVKPAPERKLTRRHVICAPVSAIDVRQHKPARPPSILSARQVPGDDPALGDAAERCGSPLKNGRRRPLAARGPLRGRPIQVHLRPPAPRTHAARPLSLSATRRSDRSATRLLRGRSRTVAEFDEWLGVSGATGSPR